MTNMSVANNGHKGLQLLYEMLAIVYHVLGEAKYMNLKAPLQPSSTLFIDPMTSTSTIETSPVQSPAPPGSPHTPEESNGIPQVQGIPPVMPFTPEETQDSYTKILALKNQYIKLSQELVDCLKEWEHQIQTRELVINEPQMQEMKKKLMEKRNQLRKELYERNLVMKGLIDRLRQLQHSVRIIQGGNAASTANAMERV